jgi:hypothetical protein
MLDDCTAGARASGWLPAAAVETMALAATAGLVDTRMAGVEETARVFVTTRKLGVTTGVATRTGWIVAAAGVVMVKLARPVTLRS